MANDLQIVQTSQAATTQKGFRQMVGEINSWNPDVPPTMVESWVQNVYRMVLDERLWYGTKVRGILSVPKLKTGGTVTVASGSASVVGVGTSFDANDVGRQFRIGYGLPTYTIVAVTDALNLTLDLPWANQNFSGSGYQIFSQLVSFGPNVKRLKTVLNQQMGWRLLLDLPKEAIDAHDTWRNDVGWARAVVTGHASPDGTPLFELYPIPTAQQAFPFSAYIQPPDLSDDNPFLVVGIPSDLIITGCIPKALLFRGKESKYYDPNTAAWHQREFLARLERLKMKDDDLDIKDLSWDYERAPLAQQSSTWAQEHDCEA